MDLIQTDVLIQGNTLAGWMAACSLLRQRDCRVLMLEDTTHEASFFIDQMNVPLLPGDSVQAYYADVRRAGAYQNDPVLVRALCEDSTEVLAELKALGHIPLALPASGRTVALHDEFVCNVLSQACRSHPAFRLMHGEGLRLMKKDGRIQGALGWDAESRDFFAISAGTALVTGRCGPTDSASGFSMAYYAGAELTDLDFTVDQIIRSAAVPVFGRRGDG